MGVYQKTLLDSEYQEKHNLFMSSITEDMNDAVSFYVSSGYDSIVKSLVSGENHGVDVIVDALQEAIRSVPASSISTLFRGTKKRRVDQYQVGDTVMFPQFMSTTTCPVVAGRFAHPEEPAVIVFHDVTHPHAAVSGYGNDEKEILLDCSSRFIVTGITVEDFCPEYDQTGYHGRVVANTTMVHMTMV